MLYGLLNWRIEMRIALRTVAAALTAILTAVAWGQQDVPYEWKPIRLGGGGFTMGIVIQPTTGERYIRVDVNGAYRWDEAAKQWKLLIRDDNVPPGDPMVQAVQYNGAQSIAVAPSDPNRVYLAWGSEYYSPHIGSLYASDDKGETWARRSSKTDFRMRANAGIGRQYGERLAVDPANADVCYFGSTDDGLWRTTDGGASWQPIPADRLPAGKPAKQIDRNQKEFGVGVPLVVFDPTGPVVDGRSQRIWCTVWREGVFRSDDAGETWTKVHDRPDVTELVVARDGTVYLTAGNHKDAQTNQQDPPFIALRFRDGQWTDITPPESRRCGNVAVSPVDPDFLFVFSFNGTAFRSHDGGQTWATMSLAKQADDVPWLAWTSSPTSMALAEVIFDPREPDRLWLCDGIGVWTAKGLDGDRLLWHSVTAGIEDLVAQHVIKAPGGPIVGAVMDRSIFVVRDPDQYATRHHPDNQFRGGRDADFCVAEPTRWAAISTGRVMTSSDDGRSWQWTGTQPAGEQIRASKLAMSAADPRNLVVVAGDRKVYFTKDGGTTWRAGEGIGQAAGAATIQADRVEPRTFYWYDAKAGLAASTDGGATWRVRLPADQLPAPALGQLAVDHRRAGHLLGAIASPQNGGVIRSTDGGRTWTRLGGFGTAWVCAFGKPPRDDAPSTIYVRGMRGDDAGIWRSTDDGASWGRIAVHPRGIHNQGTSLWADWDTFGVVYVALRGNGFAYGRPIE